MTHTLRLTMAELLRLLGRLIDTYPFLPVAGKPDPLFGSTASQVLSLEREVQRSARQSLVAEEGQELFGLGI